MRVRTWASTAYVRLAVLTATATVVAYLLAELIPWADPVPAAITALVTIRAAFHHAAKEGVVQTIGALIGASIALGIVSIIGTGPVVLFILVLLSFVLARLLRLSSPAEAPFVAAAIAVTVILVIGTHFTTELAVERFVGVAIGAACALAASYFASPTKDTRVLRTELGALQQKLADLLSEVGSGLRQPVNGETASGWYLRARDLRNESLGIDARLEDLRSHRRWSPRIDPQDLDSLRGTADSVRVMSTRVITITADIAASANEPSAPSIPPAAMSPLGELISMAADNIAADDPTEELGGTAAREAVRHAEQTAQLALIGGIVSNVNRINRASAHEADRAIDEAADDSGTEVTP